MPAQLKTTSDPFYMRIRLCTQADNKKNAMQPIFLSRPISKSLATLWNQQGTDEISPFGSSLLSFQYRENEKRFQEADFFKKT